MQIKTTMRYHVTPVRMAIIKKTRKQQGRGEKKKNLLCTVGMNVSWFSHYGKEYEHSSKINNRTIT